MKSGSIILEGC